jgi:hypothetical protein
VLDGKRRPPPDRSLTGKDEVTVLNGTYLVDSNAVVLFRETVAALAMSTGRLSLELKSDRRIALVDLLDRVLAGGVVISGEVVLSIADVDMVVISLRTLISSVSSLMSDDEVPGGAG